MQDIPKYNLSFVHLRHYIFLHVRRISRTTTVGDEMGNPCDSCVRPRAGFLNKASPTHPREPQIAVAAVAFEHRSLNNSHEQITSEIYPLLTTQTEMMPPLVCYLGIALDGEISLWVMRGPVDIV